ncbi:hypothetical protein [Candidatus Bandiella euplotis]|uniref:hypothetical protein n=1 Tax=Candidatus Bandiella euplotis TaxID=1664265 RepID=UPI002B260A58|nr:hypothetical protein [Candidatus Bandiella woodruffii]
MIKNTGECVKKRFDGNDGLIFSNQDKIVYNGVISNKKSNGKLESEEIFQDFSHQQIFDIIQDFKNIQSDKAQPVDAEIKEVQSRTDELSDEKKAEQGKDMGVLP